MSAAGAGQAADFDAWSKTATAKNAVDHLYTLEYWAERKRQGLVRVRFVGLFGGASVPGVIRRVTTQSVFVKLEGAADVQRLHPSDLRTRR